MDAAEVLLNRYRVSYDAWQSFDDRLRPSWMDSMTPRPPVCSRKRSKALLEIRRVTLPAGSP